MGKDVQHPPGEAVDPDAIGAIVRDQPGGDNPDQDASPDQDAKSVVLGSDAEPKTLYVSRQLKNADDLIAWARAAGFKKSCRRPTCTLRSRSRGRPLTG